MTSILQALLLGFVPGAVILRIPTARVSARAGLPAEERAFWSIALSVLLSTMAALALATANRYTFSRVLWIDATVVVAVLLVFRSRLRFGAAAVPPTWSMAVPLLLLAGSAYVFSVVPPAEYVMGGKDPGVYVNAGIRIAQRGGIVVQDQSVQTLPAVFRDLFFARTTEAGYYSSRFMGFFLLDPTPGTVVAQFPAGFSSWVALAYGLNGLSGARYVPVFCAVFGVVAVYMAGVRLLGRAAAAAGAGLLALNVAQLWYARYPSAEILLQPLVFAGVLAYSRAVHDDMPFFAPVAALLFTLGALTHITGIFVMLAIAAGAAVDVALYGYRIRSAFWLLLALGTVVALVFLWRYIPPYFNVPAEFIASLNGPQVAGIAGLAAVGLFTLLASRRLAPDRRFLPVTAALTLAVCGLAAYAYFVRTPAGRLAPHDANSLRDFAAFYVTPIGVTAALAGFVFIVWTRRQASTFAILVAAFSVVFFYKIRIIPEHFWAARRFLAVILPGMLLFVGAAAFAPVPASAAGIWRRFDTARARMWRRLAGVALIAILAQSFHEASRPIMRHVEYATLIPHMEALAATFGDDDLVVFEARGASDSHVLALPLAYIYARNVLVFAQTDPPKEVFREFLGWALGRYRRVFFVGGGGGGTELLSRSMSAVPVRGERFQIPEFESPVNAFPQRVRHKEFDLSVYELLPQPVNGATIDIDVGSADDLYVRRFHAKETTSGGLTSRWTRDVSFLSLVGIRAEHRTLTIWMGQGGRPPTAEPAGIAVTLGDRQLGTVTVRGGIEPYRFDIPADLAAALARQDGAAVLRLDTRTWNPARTIGGGDTRDLGVVLDRVEVR
ncbi:MAG: hypothetical protein AB7Q29_07650 [Vicinamibacterales bacterium]